MTGKPGKTLIKLPLPLTKKRKLKLARQQFSEIKDTFQLEETSYIEYKLLKLISNYTDDPQEKCSEVFRFLKDDYLNPDPREKSNSEYIVSYVDILKVTLKLCEEPRAFELLNRLNDKTKTELITDLFHQHRMVDEFEAAHCIESSLIDLLEVMEIAGVDSLEMVGHLTVGKDIKKFRKYSRKYLNAPICDTLSLEFTNISNRLVYFRVDDVLINVFTSSIFSRNVYTTLFRKRIFTTLLLLRSVHSEEVVVQVLNRIRDENVEWSEGQIIKLVKNWNELKDYPLSWSLSMNGS